ncbi:hypothetical protein GCM10010493_67240 [Streptomyces lavendulae subsp. grasserius]
MPKPQKTGEKTSARAPKNPKKPTNSESADRSAAVTNTGRSVLHTDRARSRPATHCGQLLSAGRSGIVRTPHHCALERSSSATTGTETGAARTEIRRMGKEAAATNSVSSLRATRISAMINIFAQFVPVGR